MNSETVLECSKSREPNSALCFAASWKQLESYNLPNEQCFQSITWKIPGVQEKGALETGSSVVLKRGQKCRVSEKAQGSH